MTTLPHTILACTCAGTIPLDLQAIATGGVPSDRWTHVFAPLAAMLRQHALPVPLLAAAPVSGCGRSGREGRSHLPAG